LQLAKDHSPEPRTISSFAAHKASRVRRKKALKEPDRILNERQQNENAE